MAVTPTPIAVRVRFEPSGAALDVRAGERLLDAADEHLELGLPVACRAGNCGICLLRVKAGTAAFELPGRFEREVLAKLGATADRRLGCQLRVRTDLSRGPRSIVLVLAPS